MSLNRPHITIIKEIQLSRQYKKKDETKISFYAKENMYLYFKNKVKQLF